MQFFTLLSNLMSVLPEACQNDIFLSKYILTCFFDLFSFFHIFYRYLPLFAVIYRYLPLFTVIIPGLQATIFVPRSRGTKIVASLVVYVCFEMISFGVALVAHFRLKFRWFSS